ncbi:MAG: DUF3473 domain-containing protein [Planctomycetes bacterium]|nr:DUF3473 domain-containing protein [Planctomycetota bacterium]
MIHAFTVDVEDYHNIIARDWLGREGPPTRAVVENTGRFLAHLAKRHLRGTFFVLGEVAETFPSLIREIAAGGHELGVHGFFHRQVFKLTSGAFRKEVVDAKKLIEDISGQPVRGHRAPAFSIMPNTAWALDVLADAGFAYDSSIFPIAGRRYGWPGFREDIHEVSLADGRKIIEAPMSTVTLFGKRLPACGGGYLRHFPGMITTWALKRIERNRPAIVYTHPYEIELPIGALDTSGLSPADASRVLRFHKLQLRNRGTVERKLAALLDAFRFDTLWNVIQRELSKTPRKASA